MDDAPRLIHALDDAEGIGEILQVEIAAQLAHGHGVVGHAGQIGHQPFLHAVGRADVMHVPSVRLQARNQREVRRDMSGGAAARQNDSFHERRPPGSEMITFLLYIIALCRGKVFSFL